MWITVKGKGVLDSSGFDKEIAEKARGVEGKTDRKVLEEAKERRHGPVREVLGEERSVV